MLRATLHRTLDSLRPLQAPWGSLVTPTPFSSWEFASHWLASHSADTEPFVISVSDVEGRLVAIAPWSLVRRRQRIGHRLVTGIGEGDGWYHDPFLAQPCEQALSLIARCLDETRPDWDMLRLKLRADDSPLLTSHLRRLGTLVERRDPEFHHRRIDLSEGWEAYWQTLPASLQRNLRSAQRKLASLPHRYFEVSAEDSERMLGELFRLHQARWTSEQDRKAFYAINSAEGWKAFYDFLRRLVHQSYARGEPCLFALDIQGETAAIDLLPRWGDGAYGTLRAYDPRFSHLSVGHLLNIWQFKRLHEQGVRTFDLGSGSYPYKERMRNQLVATVQLEVFNGMRGSLYGHWQGRLKPWLDQQPAWHGLKERLRPEPPHTPPTAQTRHA